MAGTSLPTLLDALQDHAAGFLAPLTAALEVGWDAELLRGGVTLVDLPGLGIAHDQYAAETRAALTDVDVVLLVVDRAGLTHSSAELLQQAGFLERVLGSWEGRAIPQPAKLIIAVTKLDQSADEAVLALERAHRSGDSWLQAWRACSSRAVDLLRAQLARALARGSRRRSEALRRLVDEHVVICPVLAREHQRLCSNDNDVPGRLQDASATGVQALAQALKQAAEERQKTAAVAFAQILSNVLAGDEEQESEALRNEFRALTRHKLTAP